jgi:hypothetical protein
MRTLTLLSLLLITSSLAFAQNSSPVSGFGDLNEGWNTFKPGGETMCAHGTEFEFWVRPGHPERLLVYLYGGGGCWDAEGCQEGSRWYTAAVEPERHPSRLSGILDLQHPGNPFAEYTMVVVPVCTGDVHLGANDTVYRLVTEDGNESEFKIRHRGKTNVLSAVAWIEANLTSPSEIFVAGSSAGSVGAPFYGSLMAQQYPEARVVSVSDDSGAFGPEVALGADPERWGLPDALRSYAGWEQFDARGGSVALAVTAGRSAPNLRVFQIDHAHDATQRSHIQRTGIEDPDVFDLLERSRTAIRTELPEFRAYTLGGFVHTSLWGPLFYRYAEEGYHLRDWTAAIAAGHDVPDVSCSACERATLTFDADDLELAVLTLEVLSGPDTWNPQDAAGACPRDTTQFSLRCAIVEAGRRSGRAVGSHPVASTLLLAAAEGEAEWRGPNSVIHFNNVEGRTREEIVDLVEQVRQRILLALGDS